MSKFSILMTIVPHDKGEKLTKAAMDAGSFGGTVFMGTQTARTNFGAILGLSDKTCDIITILAENEKKQKIRDAIIESAKNQKKDFGQIFSISSDAFLKGGTIFQGDANMEGQNRNSENKLIWAIVNKGFAEDTMFEARKAGAGGGTIVNARGTAREDDEKFFGVHIVPEKEMLMIVVPNEKYDAVMNAIKNLKYLSEPGSGIAFCSDVEDFSVLGKK